MDCCVAGACESGDSGVDSTFFFGEGMLNRSTRAEYVLDFAESPNEWVSSAMSMGPA